MATIVKKARWFCPFMSGPGNPQKCIQIGCQVWDEDNKCCSLRNQFRSKLAEQLDSRFLRLDGTNELLDDLTFVSDGATHKIMFEDAKVRIGDSAHRLYSMYGIYANLAEITALFSSVDAIFKTYPSASRHWLLNGYDSGASAYETVAALRSHATQPYFEILASGSLLPHTTKSPSLGSAAKYWNQAFVDAILCSNSIDMHPTAGDAVIYFKHDGAANEASLRYDKVNKRLELWIDGAIVGYCNAALGWVNGAP